MMQAQDFPLISHSPKRWAAFLKGRTPILESIIPLDSRGLRDWKALGKDSLIAHARWRLADGKVGGRAELEKADSGLYQALRRRELLDEVGLPGKLRDWAGMGREELVAYSKKFISENGLGGRGELLKADSGLYQALKSRKLLDEVGLPGKLRDWAGMEREELVAYSKKFISENGLGGRGELQKADSGLYQALKSRKLLDEVGLSNSNESYRNWAGMERERLVAFAKMFIAENKIGGRKELAKADLGLYQALRRRELLDEVGLTEKNRDWAGMEREELVAYAKKFISERGIGGRRELAKADGGLYYALGKRKLLDEVGLHDSRGEIRDWAGMEREDLVAYSKKFIAENGICGKKELEKADSGLYSVLRRRKLLDAVFSNLESSRHADAVNDVLDALETFGDAK